MTRDEVMMYSVTIWITDSNKGISHEPRVTMASNMGGCLNFSFLRDLATLQVDGCFFCFFFK